MSAEASSDRTHDHAHDHAQPWTVWVTAIVVGIVVGLGLGVVWWRLAPRVEVVVRDDGARPQGFQPEAFIAADVTFALIAVAAGVLVTIALLRMRRDRLVFVLGASLLSGGLGTAAMWWVGTRLGYVDLEAVTGVTDQVMEGPLEITMPGVLMSWPLAASLVICVVAIVDLVTDHSRGSGEVTHVS